MELTNCEFNSFVEIGLVLIGHHANCCMPCVMKNKEPIYDGKYNNQDVPAFYKQ